MVETAEGKRIDMKKLIIKGWGEFIKSSQIIGSYLDSLRNIDYAFLILISILFYTIFPHLPLLAFVVMGIIIPLSEIRLILILYNKFNRNAKN